MKHCAPLRHRGRPNRRSRKQTKMILRKLLRSMMPVLTSPDTPWWSLRVSQRDYSPILTQARRNILSGAK